jgi:hypothetical protein
MNRSIRIRIGAVALALAGILLYPPWAARYQVAPGSMTVTRKLGHEPLFSPPNIDATVRTLNTLISPGKTVSYSSLGPVYFPERTALTPFAQGTLEVRLDTSLLLLELGIWAAFSVVLFVLPGARFRLRATARSAPGDTREVVVAEPVRSEHLLGAGEETSKRRLPGTKKSLTWLTNYILGGVLLLGLGGLLAALLPEEEERYDAPYAGAIWTVLALAGAFAFYRMVSDDLLKQYTNHPWAVRIGCALAAWIGLVIVGMVLRSAGIHIFI